MIDKRYWEYIKEYTIPLVSKKLKLAFIKKILSDSVKEKFGFITTGVVLKAGYLAGKGVMNADKIAKLGTVTTVSSAAETTIVKSVTSKSTWIVAALVTTVEIGLLSKDLYQGKITTDQFLQKVGTKVVGNVASIGGGAAGSAAGMVVGSMLCPGVGSVVGAIIGMFLGAITAATAVEYGSKYIFEK